MARTTITDVREYMAMVNGQVETELTYQCWSPDGRKRYQLIEKETGVTYGPVCKGAPEFITLLKGFNAGRRFE